MRVALYCELGHLREMVGLHFLRLFGCLMAVACAGGCASKQPEGPVEGMLPQNAERSFADRINQPDPTRVYDLGDRQFSHSNLGNQISGSQSPHGSRAFYTGEASRFQEQAFTAGNASHLQEAVFATSAVEQKEADLRTRGEIPNLEESPVSGVYETGAARDADRAFDTRSIQPREAVVSGKRQDELNAQYPTQGPLTIDDVRELLNKERSTR